ncbi:penicillin-binding transpeptidase domain-containing protein [Streptomyces sp. INA 01156]
MARRTLRPANEDDRSYGHITVREATDKSVNAVYAQMAVDVGSDRVQQTAIDLGIPATTPELTPSPSIALGVATASALDMAEAYATLANHGEHGSYTLIEKITKDGNKTVPLPERKTRQAVSREAADTTTAVLRGVVQNGTASAAQAPAAPPPARPAPPRRTGPPGSPATHPNWPPSSPSWARTPSPPRRRSCTAPWACPASTAAALPPRSGPSSPGRH